MERLTARTLDGMAFVCSETGEEGVGHFTTQRRLPELIARLAAYEDTGLTPERVAELAQAEQDGRLVVHGQWIGRPLCGNDYCRCSKCGFYQNVHANLKGEVLQKYCPNCGAKMDL